jgi:hypothetical protein
MQAHVLGDAQAEQAFSALVWAHALQQAGQAGEARRWRDLALALAQQHGFELAGCEFGAAALLQGGAALDPPAEGYAPQGGAVVVPLRSAR